VQGCAAPQPILLRSSLTRHDPEAALLQKSAVRKAYNIVQLIYRAKNYEGPAKDNEFSRASMEEH